MRIYNQTQKTILAENAVLADTIFAGMVGLLKHSSLPQGQGMVIPSCRCIHMFFMKFAIDVIFINRRKIVVGLVRHIKPFALSPYFWRAHSAIELPSGTIKNSNTQLGDTIIF